MDDEKEINIQIPPKDREDNFGLVDPSEDDATLSMPGNGIDQHGDFFEDAHIIQRNFTKFIELTLTPHQMRLWANQFQSYVKGREDQLEEKLGDAWGMYVVKVQEWPDYTLHTRDFNPETTDEDPVKERVITTSWTKNAAMKVKHAIMAGDHPNIDPLDFDVGDIYVKVEVVPIYKDGDDLPWE